GLPFLIARHLVLTLYLPQLLYASPVWWTGQPRVLERTRKTYNKALRWATGLPIDTPLAKLYLLARLPPMDIMLDYRSLQYGIRLLFLESVNPLSSKVCPPSRRITQQWLKNIQTATQGQYPSAFQP